MRLDRHKGHSLIPTGVQPLQQVSTTVLTLVSSRQEHEAPSFTTSPLPCSPHKRTIISLILPDNPLSNPHRKANPHQGAEKKPKDLMNVDQQWGMGAQVRLCLPAAKTPWNAKFRQLP